MVLSSLPLASLPSGLKATERTVALCPGSVPISCPLDKFQSLISKLLPLARRLSRGQPLIEEIPPTPLSKGGVSISLVYHCKNSLRDVLVCRSAKGINSAGSDFTAPLCLTKLCRKTSCSARNLSKSPPEFIIANQTVP
jgi:hypothetical protein